MVHRCGSSRKIATSLRDSLDYSDTAKAAGAEARIVHIPSDFMTLCIPDMLGLARGIRQALSWFNASPERRQVDTEADARYDKLIELYERGMEEAAGAFKNGVLTSSG